MSQQIIEDLHFRYTTKKYDATKRISAEDIEIIKQALRLSASSINSQPWKFAVIEALLRNSYEKPNRLKLSEFYTIYGVSCIPSPVSLFNALSIA